MRISYFSFLAALAPFATALPISSLSSSGLDAPDALDTLSPRAPASKGTGSVTIQNNCAFPISLSSVGTSAGPVVHVAAGSSHSEQFHTTADPNTGVSIKIVKNDGNPLAAGQVTQVEYTLVAPTVYYDLSLINGDVFSDEYNAIVPSVASCPTVACQANEVPCAAAYTKPPQPKTKACASSADLVYHICS